MSTGEKDLSKEIEDAKLKYNEYAQTQRDFQSPQAHISIDTESNESTKVHIEVEYKGIEYSFQSIEEKDTDDIYRYLNSQPSVRQKYGDGNPTSLESTTARVKTFVDRFTNKTSPLYLYSGFVVSDSQTETFIGIANIGSGPEVGTSEMAFLNRTEAWSRPNDLISTYTPSDVNKMKLKTYSGVGTVEVCTLLQYAIRLKKDGYQVNGHPLKAVVATSRIDNDGSWKSCAKAGMILHDLQINSHRGTNLRYQLRKYI